MYMSICIYTCLYRQREREREIYIYIYMCIWYGSLNCPSCHRPCIALTRTLLSSNTPPQASVDLSSLCCVVFQSMAPSFLWFGLVLDVGFSIWRPWTEEGGVTAFFSAFFSFLSSLHPSAVSFVSRQSRAKFFSRLV